MLLVVFFFVFVIILGILQYINSKEGLYLYDISNNLILDSDKNPVQSYFLIPTINDSRASKLISMYSDISFCDNLDDLSYSVYNNKNILNDDMLFYNKYKEGFSEYNMSLIEKIYLFLIGLLIIYLLTKKSF